MGKLRVDTIAKLLASSEGNESIVANYVSIKTLKLWVKNPNDSSTDVYEKYRPLAEKFVKQAAVARMFMSEELAGKVVDQSPRGAAQTSEEMGFILKCCNRLRAASDSIELVNAYAGLLSLLVNSSEPLVKHAVSNILIQIERDTPPQSRRELFSRPLAVAVGVRFEGSPKDAVYRRNVDDFLRTYLSEQMQDVSHSVSVEQAGEQIAETSKLLKAYREALEISDV